VVWAIDFQFDSTIDGKAIKIGSMIVEHTRVSLMNLVERSITAVRLVTELEAVFAAAGGPPKVLRMDNGSRVGFSGAATVLRREGPVILHTARHTVEQRLHRIVQRSPSEGVPQPEALEHPVRGSGGDRRLQTSTQLSPPAFGARLPDVGPVRCGVPSHPHPGGLRDQLHPEYNNPTPSPG
jgi:hypothetical protein